MVSTGSVVETTAEDTGRQFIFTVIAENVRDFAMVIAHQYQVREDYSNWDIHFLSMLRIKFRQSWTQCCRRPLIS